jgi:Leucine-rich repeat (LRR) protein
MKKLYLLFTAIFVCHLCTAQIINFPDANFKTKLLNYTYPHGYVVLTGNIAASPDLNSDGEIDQIEAANVISIVIYNANITNLEGLQYFTNLRALNVGGNQIGSIDLTSFVNLEELHCMGMNLATLDLSPVPNLKKLWCGGNPFTSLDVSDVPNLIFFGIDNSAMSTIDFSQNPMLQSVYIEWTSFTSLDFTANTQLTTASLGHNNLTTLNVAGLSSLSVLSCLENQLTSIDLSGLTSLKQLSCSDNQVTSFSFDPATLVSLEFLDISRNPLGTLSISGLPVLREFYCIENQLTSLSLSGMPNFREVYAQNNDLVSLSFTGMTGMWTVDVSENNLTSIDVSNLPSLQMLACLGNQIQALDLSSAPTLTRVDCGFNPMTSLVVSGLINLRNLSCFNNQLTSLDCSGLTNLENLLCDYNQISNLNIDGANNIKSLNCTENQLTSLDVSHLTFLQYLQCFSNDLTSINVKNGSIEVFEFAVNPNLEYICADEGQISEIQSNFVFYNIPNCHVNSYCSFTPGGNFYTIQGSNNYDGNNNGCEITDLIYPQFKLAFSDGTNAGSIISDDEGNYRYDVQQGTHTFVPVLENPAYFNVSPNSATVIFPSQPSPLDQHFCLTANGLHNDLEVVLLPYNQAMAGDDAYYKIIYKNKGTHAQSGQISLAFDDDVLDFLYSSPVVSGQSSNSLTWSFTGLEPFETRQITLSVNLNGATEVPALNSGDILDYALTISGGADETPVDNVSTVSQTVVNSFDPNDKTCLEGNTISPDMIGKYVHYIIRFENTGSANAQNIVVKDMIDTSKFDVATLIPLSGSHPFITKITNTNKVEFIFENINLPFDNASNDGYVAFKIKTKPTLVVGDTFSNTANIYFDYNFPIVTNTATTAIQLLGTPDFEFSNYFTLYPNPAKNVVNIETKSSIQLKSAEIYNMLGQLVLAVTNMENSTSIDVADLTAGNYFIKISSDKGTSSAKFIKE